MIYYTNTRTYLFQPRLHLRLRKSRLQHICHKTHRTQIMSRSETSATLLTTSCSFPACLSHRPMDGCPGQTTAPSSSPRHLPRSRLVARHFQALWHRHLCRRCYSKPPSSQLIHPLHKSAMCFRRRRCPPSSLSAHLNPWHMPIIPWNHSSNPSAKRVGCSDHQFTTAPSMGTLHPCRTCHW